MLRVFLFSGLSLGVFGFKLVSINQCLGRLLFRELMDEGLVLVLDVVLVLLCVDNVGCFGFFQLLVERVELSFK